MRSDADPCCVTRATQKTILWRNLMRNPHMLLWVAGVIGCTAFGLWWVALLSGGMLGFMFALAVYLNRRRAKIDADLESRSG
jgi:hypothetical protein